MYCPKCRRPNGQMEIMSRAQTTFLPPDTLSVTVITYRCLYCGTLHSRTHYTVDPAKIQRQ